MHQKHNHNRKTTSLSHLPTLQNIQNKEKHYRCQCCKNTQYIDYNRQKRLKRERSLINKIQRNTQVQIQQESLVQNSKREQLFNQHKKNSSNNSSQIELPRTNRNMDQKTIESQSLSKNEVQFIKQNSQFQKVQCFDKTIQIIPSSTNNSKCSIQVRLNDIVYEITLNSKEQMKRVIDQIKQILGKQERLNEQCL